ncbi:MAG: dicarboxylate/amino acid:cation symporter [Clostridiales bacterium]|nr:dicarboxylate/amino acid:cation symporter [Clostridiales bacterium]
MEFSWISLAALAAAGVLFAFLAFLSKRGVDFSLRTIIGLGLGVLLGLAFRGSLDYVSPFGSIYINVITVVVAPLIILSSVTSLETTKKLRSLGGRSVFWLLLNTLLAILLSLGAGLLFGVGSGSGVALEGVDTAYLEERKVSVTDVFVDFFPSNLVSDIQSNRIIPIIIGSLVVAAAYIAVKDRVNVAPFKSLVEAAKEIVFKVVEYIIGLTPYAVLVLVASAVSRATSAADTILPLLLLLAVTYAVCIIHTYLINGVLVAVGARVNPVRFFRHILSSQVTAFTTQSSVGTLPVNIRNLTKKVGVSEEVANFTGSLGATIGMPGCAGVWPVLLAVFAINALGIEYSVLQYALLAVIALAVSFGTAGVPGTATVTATAVFTAAGLPLEVIVLLTPISAIADMARTATNVTAAAVSATIVAKRQGALDLDVFTVFEAADPRRVQVAAG